MCLLHVLEEECIQEFVHLTENHFFNPHKPYGLNPCKRRDTVLDRKLYR